jgi:hypothetical protein
VGISIGRNCIIDIGILNCICVNSKYAGLGSTLISNKSDESYKDKFELF